MKKRSIVYAVILVLIITVFTVPAMAGGSAKGFCELNNGHWVSEFDDGSYTGDGANIGKCYYARGESSPYADCGEAYGVIETWNYGFQSAVCIIDTSSFPKEEFVTQPNISMDAWVGSCGVHVFSAPAEGTVTITKPNKAALPQPAPNLGKVCEVTYLTTSGDVLTNWFSITMLYYNLDKSSKTLYDQGKLNLFILKNGAWSACPNMGYLADEGSSGFGRVYCLSSGPAAFGIGKGLGNYSIPDPIITLDS